jgi:cellulose biosynthesis protein BcsQ
MLAGNLAVAAALDGRKPLLVDLDDQASSLALWATLRTERGAVEPVQARGLGWDELATELDAAKKTDCGLVIIDTPGKKDQVASLAASVANIVLVAVQTPMVDLATLSATFKLRNVTNRPAFVILNRVRNKATLREARNIVEELGFELAPLSVSDLPAFSEAFDRGLGVLEYELGDGATIKAQKELAVAQAEISTLYEWAVDMVRKHSAIAMPAPKKTWNTEGARK